MRLSSLAGPFLFVAGVAALVVGFLQKEATLSVVVIIPVITATGAWAFLGIVLMMAGVFIFFLTWSGATDSSSEPPPPVQATPSAPAPAQPSAARHRWGGVVFLGPIPIVFGSDQKITRWMLLVGVLLFVALLVFTVIALWGV